METFNHQLIWIIRGNYPNFILAFAVTVFLIYMLRPLAIRLDLVDYPSHRKKHAVSIPLVGGIAMYLGFLFALVTLGDSLSSYRSFITSAGILVIVGVLDDLHELSAKNKFIVQLLAIILMIAWGGVKVGWVGYLIPGQPSFLGIWSWPFTVIAAIAVINAINMADGLDGLAGSYVLTALIAILILTINTIYMTEAKILLILISVIIGFLVFNTKTPWRNNASVFMGDAGSMFLGFTLVWFTVSLSQGEERIMNPVTALWFLALPLFDVVGVTIWRLMRRKHVFTADRQHFHHIFKTAGCSTSSTVAILFFISVVFASIGILGHVMEIKDSTMFYSFVSLFVLYYFLMLYAWNFMIIKRKNTD